MIFQANKLKKPFWVAIGFPNKIVIQSKLILGDGKTFPLIKCNIHQKLLSCKYLSSKCKGIQIYKKRHY